MSVDINLDPNADDAKGNTVPGAPATQGGNAPGAPAPQGNGTVLAIPEKQMRRIKQEARENGRKSLLRELGFATEEELKSAVNAGKRAAKSDARPAPQASKPDATPTASGNSKADAANNDLVAKLAKERALAQKQARQQSQMRARAEAEYEIKLAAHTAGALDPELMVSVVDRELRNKTEDEAKAFDLAKFFDDLKGKRPGYFVSAQAPAPITPTAPVVKQPVTTSTGGAAPVSRASGAPVIEAPTPVTPGVGRSDGKDALVDTRSMTPEQFRKHLADKYNIAT